MNDVVKTCRVCGETKLLSEFGKSGKTTGSGYKAVCKICLAKKLKDWRVANPDKAKDQDKLFRDRNKEKISIKNQKRYKNLTLEQKFDQLVKTAGKRKNKKCFITVEHLHDVWQRQEGLCVYTKLPLTSEGHQLNTVSLDRVDSSKDYTVDNIQLVCVPINRMKLDYTEDQFIELCRLVTHNVSKQTT
jgi:hypothetical protein